MPQPLIQLNSDTFKVLFHGAHHSPHSRCRRRQRRENGEYFPITTSILGGELTFEKTLVQALCGAPSISTGNTPAGCKVSVRLTEDQYFQEFYDLSGAPRYRHGRQLFYMHSHFDCVLFVYDVTDATTRTAISTTWVPEVMTHLGDVGAVEKGGRLEGHDVHVRSSGVIHELRFLWREALLSHTTISPIQALSEAVRLSWRLLRLLLNETGIWCDQAIDLEAERLYLSTSTVPCAIIGMKADMLDREDLLEGDNHSTGKSVPHIKLHANSVSRDSRLHIFLRRAGESVRRKSKSSPHKPTRRQLAGPSMLRF